jgi:serine/threonine protein kinase
MMISGNVPMFSNEEKISHYELARELGKGGFATVHEARRKADGLLVACKMIDRKKLEQDNTYHYPLYGNHRHVLPNSRATSMLERLNAEITIHHQVKHPNIVELLNCFYDEKYIYLILELCSHGDLERYLKEKQTLSESETQNIAKQVVDGLVYLHNHGIIHRDIKLSNLLLTETLEVKIADFGLAKRIQLTREQNNETMCGTPNYISPEIASRTPHSFATDVWSLGILIVTLLTGHPPFDTDTVHGTLSKVTHEKYELPTTFSEEAQDLVNSTLRKTAELRPNIIEIRDHPFFSKDFSRSSQSNNYKFPLWGPAVDRSHDSGFVENIAQQRSTISTGSNSTSVVKGTYVPRIFSPNSGSSPSSSQHNEPIYKTKSTRNKSYDYYLNHPSQQPIYIGQSPSLDMSSRYNDCTYNGTISLNDHRPTSATSSVRSQDSGVAQSDPKTSIDCSAKSESSPKVSLNNSNNYYLLNNPPSTMARHRSSSSTNSIQHLLPSQHQQQDIFDTNTEQLREKLQPFNTQRLKPHRQATKAFIMSMMENGEVVLETIRTKSTKRRIVDVFRVSSDGLHIITYTPNSRHGSPASNHPPPIPHDKNAYQEYHFDRLPSEYWKKYQYAHKFATLVRSRTPKIILYTPDAKCSLMENDVDFESVFLCGVKISIFQENGKPDDPLKIKILNNSDKSESLLEYDRVAAPNISAIEHFSPEIRQMIDNTIMVNRDSVQFLDACGFFLFIIVL